jgi:hypothetical protein
VHDCGATAAVHGSRGRRRELDDFHDEHSSDMRSMATTTRSSSMQRTCHRMLYGINNMD